MKVPKGKTVYIGRKKIKAGGEVPEELAKILDKPPKAPKPEAGKPTVKP